ncbi:Pterin-4-alpha-carbinolamine dehydratase [[Actinomadura] parvosata subsp. kistnae]|uniref:Putative pterin-4-alpha-carbinolamine dehydratase n=1 Tax=[Actinomadura] parvosata subsp. kistnae TaxID=1909395 RepID=A0A1V0AGK7_9ACTN|nr:4a-hydroxytetrahydrobiopterin dehydratase [Nonomuraea sp. ATCC 55076]AQZ69326.1 4a-hydroxytetrahydrobiopterin dehydratase [Nonomuraea sp. ATCC 55076]SPL92039.1 Pterin-4-alpha-carbinolamine dehydratase [Actinomadura parvosata subsp. kistnae]
MDVESKLKDLPRWRRAGEAIKRTVSAPDFPTAIRIVDEIAVKAEELGHHPDIDIRWRDLHLTLTTHDQGGLTDLDFTLAAVIDEIAAKHGAQGE